MKRICYLISYTIFTLSLFSCTASKEPVVGVWGSTILKPLQMTSQPNTATQKPLEVTSEKFEENGSVLPAEPESKQLISTYPDVTNTIKIKANKRVTLISTNSKLNGSWKINQQDKTIDITLDKSKRFVRLKYQGINRDILTLIDKTPSGQFLVTFQKIDRVAP